MVTGRAIQCNKVNSPWPQKSSWQRVVRVEQTAIVIALFDRKCDGCLTSRADWVEEERPRGFVSSRRKYFAKTIVSPYTNVEISREGAQKNGLMPRKICAVRIINSRKTYTIM